MLRQRSSSIVTLAALLALSPVSFAVIQTEQIVQAQAPDAAVPAGTRVRINSSPSVTSISQTLKQQFESKFPGSTVELNQTLSAEALKALEEGRIDLAAIGRALTPEEKAAGFVQEPITRRKIAVVVGDKNPFPGDMTGEQFASIFRGEIANWSEVGGSNKPIRVLDRINSDTRIALQPYPVFQAGAFETGTTGQSIDDAATEAMLSQLGDDGISYALVDQVTNQPGVKIVSLYGTPPTDPSYPFSQQLSYVYKGSPSPAVQAFLGVIQAPEAQQSLAAPGAPAAPNGAPASAPAPAAPVAPAPIPTAPDAPAAAVSPSVTAADPAQPGAAQPDTVAQAPAADAGADAGANGGIPGWLWLLSLPLLGGLIWALLKGLGGSDEVETVTGAAAASSSGAVSTATLAADRAGENSRIVLSARNGQDAYAYWEVPEAHKQRLRKEEGAQNLSLRLYDVTGLEFDRHPAHSIEEFECDESDQDLHFPVPQPDRDYLVQLGYVTYQGRWVKLAQSNAVHIAADGTVGTPPARSASVPTIPAPTLPAAMPAPGAPDFSLAESSFGENSFTENNFTEGMPLVDPASLAEPADRLDNLNRLASEAMPEASERTAIDPMSDQGADRMDGFGMAGVAGVGAAGAAAMAASSSKSRVKRSQIMLSPHGDHDAEAEWEVLEHHKEIAKQHGGQNFILRICDVTGVDLENQAPHSIQQFNCEESDTSRTVTVPDNGEYVAEIGYLAKNGRWLRIARSAPVHIST
jgi:ABC-type phosphate transport system substrate-binding protein